MKKMFTGILLGVMLTLGISVLAENIDVVFNGVTVMVNGVKIEKENIIYDGTTYLPLRAIAEALGQQVSYTESTKTVNINSSGGGLTDTANVIESSIDGDFEGFEYGKIYKLMNGQIWEQISSDISVNIKFFPRVTIYNSDGIYKMKIDGIDRTVMVKRIK